MEVTVFCSRIAHPFSPEMFVARVTVYSTASCSFCERTKFMLDKWEIPYDEIRIDRDAEAMSEFEKVTDGARTVPQIVIDGKPIGGFDELTEMHMDGDLDELVQD